MAQAPTFAGLEPVPQVAFYYPGPSWVDSDWIKNLILFFDGVGLLVPSYMLGQPGRIDPAIAAGLEEHGLLYELEPETLVDQGATERLAETMIEIIASGALDELAHQGTEFQALSYSRMGYYGDAGLAHMLVSELEARGLARFGDDLLSIQLHPIVRSLVLVLLAQILRPYGSRFGIDLSPATDRTEVVEALRELLGLPGSASAPNVVSLDLETVSVDLGAFPIDEVLAFRRQYSSEFRAYTRSVRSFVRDVGMMPDESRREAFNDRREELRDLASNLRSRSKSAWRKRASFALSLTGSFWKVAHGDLLGGLFTGSSTVLARTSNTLDGGAYSYLFRAHRRFG